MCDLLETNSLVILEAQEHACLAHIAVADDYQLHCLYGHFAPGMLLRRITKSQLTYGEMLTIANMHVCFLPRVRYRNE